MTGRLCSLFLFALFLASLPAQKAQPLSADQRISEFVRQTGIHPEGPGMALLITQNGRILHEHYLGLANLDNRQAITGDTPFQIASATKPFTALAIAQLVDAGKLEFNDSIRRYLPSLAWDELRIRHLLTHQGGIPEHTAIQVLRSPASNTDVIRMMEGKRLRFQPGTQMRYGNTGYVLLAQIVEQATGQPYPTYLKEQVFRPAGMSRSIVPQQAWNLIPGRAVGYQKNFRMFTKEDNDSMIGVVGHSGIYASTRELDRFLSAYHNGQLCKSTTLKEMLQVHSVSGDGYSYGYGWTITPLNPGRLIWHNGRWLGFDSFIGRIEGTDINLVFLSNAGLSKRQIDVTKDLMFPLAQLLASQR